MFYFLGIVLQRNLRRGIIEPSFILCRDQSVSRSGFQMVRVGGKRDKLPRALVTTPLEHPELEQYAATYRYRERPPGDTRYHRRKRLKKYVVGALFYFECNAYGERAGPALFVTRTPVTRSGAINNNNKKNLEDAMRRRKSVKELLIETPHCLALKENFPHMIIGGDYGRRNENAETV